MGNENYLIEKKAVEFTIESTEPLDEEEEFLAIRVGEKDDESGWFNLYRSDYEMNGDYEYLRTLEHGEDFIKAAIDWMVEEQEYKRETLAPRKVDALDVANEPLNKMRRILS